MKRKSFISIILFLLVAIFYFIVNCNPCENTEIKRIASPNGLFDFVLFERNCGATTDFSVQGAILKNGKSLPSNSGNAIIMGSENYINQSNISVYPTWINNTEVKIECKEKPQIFHQYEIFGVTVTVEQKLN